MTKEDIKKIAKEFFAIKSDSHYEEYKSKYYEEMREKYPKLSEYKTDEQLEEYLEEYFKETFDPKLAADNFLLGNEKLEDINLSPLKNVGDAFVGGDMNLPPLENIGEMTTPENGSSEHSHKIR